jgi:hypothetical protein
MGYQLIKSINAAAIARFHDDSMSVSGGGQAAGRGTGYEAVWRRIEEDHHCNLLLRSERERAQHAAFRDADRAARKRRIARYELLRHQVVGAIDEALLRVLGDGSRHPGARLYSESAGTLIDRLSLLAIEIHHVRNGARSPAPSASLTPAGRAKLVLLVEQRMEVARALDELVAGAVLHILYFKAYQPQLERDPGRPAAPAKPGTRTMIPG